MATQAGTASLTRYWLRLGIFRLLLPLTLLGCERGPEQPQVSLTPITAAERVASFIAAKHYLSPERSEVIQHTQNIEQLNQYLGTLDPYSTYLTAQQTQFFQQRGEESRLGVGINFMVKGDDLLAVPVYNGPAYLQGFQTPEYIESIDGRKIRYSDFSSYAFLTQLKEGQSINIVFKAGHRRMSDELSLFAWPYLNVNLDGRSTANTLFIQMQRFVRGQNDILGQLLSAATDKQRLVIDLRYSPGGDVYAMVDMLSFLLEEGVEVVRLNKNHLNEPIVLKTLNGQLLKHLPIYILVSEFTASSAELFTRAMRQHYGQLQVYGMPTKGKCLAQEGMKFDDGTSIRLSSFEVLDYQGQPCQGKSIVPDKIIEGIVHLNNQQIDKLLEPF